MSCRSLCNVLQCLGDETPSCDFAIQLCVSTITDSTHKHTVNKYCMYEESTCIHGNSDSKTVLMLLKCFLKDIHGKCMSYLMKTLTRPT